MNRTEWMLTCLSEECNEVAMEVLKLLKVNENDLIMNRDFKDKLIFEKVSYEVDDLLSVINMLNEQGIIMESDVNELAISKAITLRERNNTILHKGAEAWMFHRLFDDCHNVAQRVSKALRFGLDEVQAKQSYSNRLRVSKSIDRLLSTLDLLQSASILQLPNEENQVAKKDKIQKYLKYAEEIGAVDVD